MVFQSILPHGRETPNPRGKWNPPKRPGSLDLGSCPRTSGRLTYPKGETLGDVVAVLDARAIRQLEGIELEGPWCHHRVGESR